MKKLYLTFALLCAVSMMADEVDSVGLFSVNDEGGRVFLAPGNLQYCPSTAVWRFADNQYDYLGFDNNNISDTYDGWLDLFGWGSGAQPTLLTKIDDFVDWGTNPIANGGNEAGLWRSLSYDEWNYLLNGRVNASSLMAKAQVCGVNGLILLPDAWDLTDTLILKTDDKKYADNMLDSAQWVEWDSLGAVFLPAAGYRMGKNAQGVSSECNYWVDTAFTRILWTTEDNYNDPISVKYANYANWGMSVRLAKDYIEPSVIDDQAIDDPSAFDDQSPSRKIIKDGRLFILRHNKIFTPHGLEVQ